ncbi:hypothetical protein Pcinc_023108 [Petrolisthes cinctipes]|uniref:Uncharacterized protein n=1 Tax=Petrolisthes cinctipes TaxID=88211 RepID=A0AAE1KG59_PETCI|nr:hypothetical protein Pcinc_023108 [Petrolisthes cinctipes]
MTTHILPPHPPPTLHQKSSPTSSSHDNPYPTHPIPDPLFIKLPAPPLPHMTTHILSPHPRPTLHHITTSTQLLPHKTITISSFLTSYPHSIT